MLSCRTPRSVVISLCIMCTNTELRSKIRLNRTPSASSSEGPSTMTKTIFLRANRVTCLSKCKGDVVIVCRLVNRLALFTEHDIPVIKIAQIVIRFYVRQPNISILWVGRSKGDKSTIQRFLRTKIMRCEDQLSFPFFSNDVREFPEQILEHAGIQLIDCHRYRRTVVYANQKVQNRDDLFDTF